MRTALTASIFLAGAGAEVLLARKPVQVEVPHVEGGSYYAALLSGLRTRYPTAESAADALRGELDGLRADYGSMAIPGGTGVRGQAVMAPLGVWYDVATWWLALAQSVAGAAASVHYVGKSIRAAIDKFATFVAGVPGLRIQTISLGRGYVDVRLAERCELELEALAVALDEGNDGFQPAHPDDRSYWDFAADRAGAVASDIGGAVAGVATSAAHGALRALVAPAGAAVALAVVGYVLFRRSS